MSGLSESVSPKQELYCELCDCVDFASYSDWQVHHLHHLRQPVVRLVKLNQKLCLKLLQGKSYRVNTGVARSSQHHVPPLKISLIKKGAFQFTVKRGGLSSNSTSPVLEDRFSESDSRESWNEFGLNSAHLRLLEVEGKDLLERLGANFSISRRGNATSPGAVPKKPEAPEGPRSPEDKRGNILERLSGIGGISISAVSKSCSAEPKPSSGISISSKAKSIELSQLKTLKDNVIENEKKIFDQNKILEKLSGSGLISIAPKSGAREGKDCREESRAKGDKVGGSPKPDSLEKLGSPSLKSNKSEDSNDSSDSKVSGDGRTGQVNASDEIGKTMNGIEVKKFVRVKQSSFKKNARPERQGSQDEGSEEKAASASASAATEDKGYVPGETGIDILERLTENLNNTVAAEKSGAISPPDSSSPAVDPLAIDTESSGGLNAEMKDDESKCPEETSETRFRVAEENPQEQVQALVLTPPSSSGQDGENSNYSTISQNQPESFAEPDNVSEGNNEVRESEVSFTDLAAEDQSEDQGEQQTAFWSDIQNSSSNVDQPQEDPLLTPENPVSNGETSFLHNFSPEYQPPASGIPTENSEFMSLDRLGQTQHQQPPFRSDPSTPMEHLNQQVQRIPNPTPQINVISQHHLQAQPPPQLHTGVPLSPQHISPQQANSYDALHMQPPMPPPLYQGYMYNQSYPPQPPMPRGPQSQPPMPMLQQRPHMPSRAYQPVPGAQRPRPRSAVKRSHVRPSQEMMAPAKHPRMNPPLQVRPPVPNPATKLPSGITITPPKKTSEATKVANVLASRGITVTPSRQTSQSARPQQQRSQPGSSPSVLNISSAVSITSSSQNRSSGGFAVPGPRRSAPIVNHNAERPERCMTVDLTQDDDVPSSQSRQRSGLQGRFYCNTCDKYLASPSALAAHKAQHRKNLTFKCDLCSFEFSSMMQLVNHKQMCHKKPTAPDLAIPIVDLNHPGARDQLRKCGVYNFIPLAQLQSNSNGYFGVPIIQLDTAKEKAVSNLSLLGAGNILVLGKMKAITPQTSQ